METSLARQRLMDVLSIALIVALWTLLAALVGTAAIPFPTAVVAEIAPLLTSGAFVEPLLGSFARTMLGFIGAMVLGLAYGIAAARSDRFNRWTSGLFNVALFAPTLIVVFVGLLILGVDSWWSVVLVTVLTTFPGAGVYMRDVLAAIDDEMLVMARSYKVTGPRLVRDVYLPYLTPPLLSTSRLTLNTAWKVVVLAEVFGFPSGLGFEIRINYSSFNVPKLLAWLVVFIVALLAVEQVMRLLERRLVRWR